MLFSCLNNLSKYTSSILFHSYFDLISRCMSVYCIYAVYKGSLLTKLTNFSNLRQSTASHLIKVTSGSEK